MTIDLELDDITEFSIPCTPNSRFLNLTTDLGVIGNTHIKMNDLLVVSSGRTIELFDSCGEKLDEEKSHNRYGASNITVIFNNNGK